MGEHDDGGRMLDYGHVKTDSEEGRMMKQALRDIAVDAYRLHQMLNDNDDLPQWCHYKAAQVQQMIGSVRNYLEYKLERMGEDPVGEEEMFDPEEMEEDFGEESAKMAADTWDEGGDEDDEDYEDSESFDPEDMMAALGGDLNDSGYDNADVPVSFEKEEDE